MLKRESNCPFPAHSSQTGLFTFQPELVTGMNELGEIISGSKEETVSREAGA